MLQPQADEGISLLLQCTTGEQVSDDTVTGLRDVTLCRSAGEMRSAAPTCWRHGAVSVAGHAYEIVRAQPCQRHCLPVRVVRLLRCESHQPGSPLGPSLLEGWVCPVPRQMHACNMQCYHQALALGTLWQ